MIKLFDWKRDWWIPIFLAALIFSAWAYRHDIRQYQKVFMRFCEERCEDISIPADSICNYCPRKGTMPLEENLSWITRIILPNETK